MRAGSSSAVAIDARRATIAIARASVDYVAVADVKHDRST